MNSVIKLSGPRFTYLAFSFYILLSLAKMHAYAFEGRFWAEEGVFFFSNINNLNFINGLLFIFNGHLELMTNIVVKISTLVDFKYAPLVCTWLSYSLQSIPILIVIIYRNYIGISNLGILAFITILTGLPQSPEVWANSINLHFHFALLAVLIAIINIEGNYPIKTFRCLLIACGLSGIPANFITPIFFLIAYKTKERERWVHFFILFTTSIIQLLLLASNKFDFGHRDLVLNFPITWFSIISQQIFSPTIGIKIGNKLSKILSLAVLNQNPKILLLSLTMLVPYIAWLFIAFKENSLKLKILLISMLIILLFSIYTAIGSADEKISLIHSPNGGRYFFVPNVIALIALLIISKNFKRSYLLSGFLLILTFSALFRVSNHIGGPSWKVEYNQSTMLKSPTIKIWPDGWKMKKQN